MKCTNRIIFFLLTVTISFSLCGCGNLSYKNAYSPNLNISAFDIIGDSSHVFADSFASPLVVDEGDILPESVDMSEAGSAILYSLDDRTVLFSKNANLKMYPASLTKVMTALVALKYGSPDQVLKATGAVNVTESGATLIGLKAGDTMTLDQALHVLLINSSNDAALLIADCIGGSVERFVEMMNEEAARIGATNTSFCNPNGLTDENHYTTAYDLYLIFNEALKYEEFKEIIPMTSYETVYYDQNGKAKNVSISTTNQYLKGVYQSPDGVTVIGGKTGTTNAAGHCLILYSKDDYGASYISVILSSSSREKIYEEMSDMLSLVKK
ncbi:MAG: serine hydrolase [Acetatifactor sp.]|nr:serine hydrolase [Acetatifactor sp.]